MGGVRVVLVAVVLALVAAVPAGAATGCVLDSQTCTIEAGGAQATCYAQPSSGSTQDDRGCVAVSGDGAAAGCLDEDTTWGASTGTSTGCTASAGVASASCGRSTENLSITGSGEQRTCGATAGDAAAGCADADWQDPGSQAGEQYDAVCEAPGAGSCTSNGETNFTVEGASSRQTSCATPAGTCAVAESPDPLTQQENPFAPDVPAGVTNPPTADCGP